MLIQLKRWRVAKVTLADLRAAAGLGDDAESHHVMAGLRRSFGPLGPRVRIFIPDPQVDADGKQVPHPGTLLVVVGIEVESFDVRAPGLPFAGFSHADPLDEVDLAREEGALRGEMERLGIRVDVDEMEWRVSYEVKGD